jgi:hypothetical protein
MRDLQKRKSGLTAETQRTQRENGETLKTYHRGHRGCTEGTEEDEEPRGVMDGRVQRRADSQIRGGTIHEIEAMGIRPPYGSKTGWEQKENPPSPAGREGWATLRNCEFKEGAASSAPTTDSGAYEIGVQTDFTSV